MIRLVYLGGIFVANAAWATTPTIGDALVRSGELLVQSESLSSSITLLLTLASIGFIPMFLMATTSFLRTVIILSMIRQAIGTAQAPPNPVIIILSLFVTAYVMAPVFVTAYDTAIVPYNNQEITQLEAFSEGAKPFREFMTRHASDNDIQLFVDFSNTEINRSEGIPFYILIPAFIISELKSAFQVGFLIYLPFVVIDLLISNILLTLGMFMLSPAMVSMPFKILLFVLVDGWNLIIRGLLLSFQ